MRVNFEGSVEEMQNLFGKVFVKPTEKDYEDYECNTEDGGAEEGFDFKPQQKVKKTRKKRNSHKVWNKEEIATLLDLFYKGKRYSRIGKVLNRTAKAVNVKLVDLRREGVLQHRRIKGGTSTQALPVSPRRSSRRRPKMWTQQEDQELIRLVEEGRLSKTQIAARLQRQLVAISIRCRGLAKQRGWRKGRKGSWMP
jgi:hypothetical protein